MSYRPITDIWFLARAKLKGGTKYYGAYLGGFPERARVLIGAGINEPVLHVCGGMAKLYPYRGGFGPKDKTLDLDPLTEPDYLQDACAPLPPGITFGKTDEEKINNAAGWAGILIDPPYSESDAERYAVGSACYPSPSKLVANALTVLHVGGKVGIIHYSLPKQPKDSKFVACVGVACGFGNRMRCFSVFEKLEGVLAG